MYANIGEDRMRIYHKAAYMPMLALTEYNWTDYANTGADWLSYSLFVSTFRGTHKFCE